MRASEFIIENADPKKDPEAYRTYLENHLKFIMGFFDRAIKQGSWKPSEKEMMDAIDIAYKVMKQTGDVKVAGKALNDYVQGLYKKSQGVAEGFPQPGESSGKAKQFNPNAKVQTKEMTLDQILATVKGIPYVNNVVDDWDAKDYSWGVTKKVIEYAEYLQKNPQSVANLPPLVVIDGQLNDGAHRLSAINLLQKRMDPKNPLWKQVKLKVNFGTSADVAAEQGVAENTNSKKISFKIQKGKNKFATTMTVNNQQVGVYQYDADTGRSIAEIYPEYKGQGLGKLLVLHAIYSAAKLGLDFLEDESRTAEYDNVLDSLSSNGYIVDDDGYWYVTKDGEQYLKNALNRDVTEGKNSRK